MNLRKAKEKLQEQIFHFPGVVSVGEGDGFILVYALAPLPELPEVFEGHPVIVKVVSSEPQPLQLMFGAPDRRDQVWRPYPGGVQISAATPFLFFLPTLGTLGMAVKMRDGTIRLLSNAHVLESGQITTWEHYLDNKGLLILQPGGLDLTNAIATVDTWITMAEGGVSIADAALAKPFNPGDVDTSILGLSVPSSVIDPVPGLIVKKSGRNTGVTTGIVEAINVTTRMTYQQYSSFSSFSTLFNNCFTVTPGNFGSGGDSGSVVMAGSSAVGLLFAGTDQLSFGTPMRIVRDNLGFVLPDGPAPRPVVIEVHLGTANSLDMQTWAIWIDTPPGQYLGGDQWEKPPFRAQVAPSGAYVGFTVWLKPGSYTLYLAISSPKGVEYSGTLEFGANRYQIVGLDSSKLVAVPLVTSGGIFQGALAPKTPTGESRPSSRLGTGIVIAGVVGAVGAGLFLPKRKRRKQLT
mgnify:CR=1 FL=1